MKDRNRHVLCSGIPPPNTGSLHQIAVALPVALTGHYHFWRTCSNSLHGRVAIVQKIGDPGNGRLPST